MDLIFEEWSLSPTVERKLANSSRRASLSSGAPATSFPIALQVTLRTSQLGWHKKNSNGCKSSITQ